jgi:hypothetical protein
VDQFTSTGSFFVKDKSGNYYPATFLVDASGSPVVDHVLLGTPNKSPHTPQDLTLYSDRVGTVMANANNYLVVPSADFMNKIYEQGERYGVLRDIDPGAAQNLLYATFAPKVGFGDAQYQDKWSALFESALRTPDHFIPAFTNAGNFGAGVFGQGANAASNGAFSPTELLQTFGSANVSFGGKNTSAPFGNSPWGYEAINQGYSATTVRPRACCFLPESGFQLEGISDSNSMLGTGGQHG